MRRPSVLSPSDDFINNSLLLEAALSQVNTGGFDAFVTHKVSQKSNVVVFVKKVLGETMAERMWVYHLGVKPILFRVVFKLLRYSTGGDSLSEPVEKQIACCPSVFCEPFRSFLAEFLRDEDSTVLAAFSIDVEISDIDVFHLDLHQLTDACACGCKVSHDKIPLDICLLFQFILEECIVLIADDILQIRLLLYLDGLESKPWVLGEFQVFVQSLNPEVHGLGFEILHQIGLVGQKVPLGHLLPPFEVVLYCKSVCRDGVVRHILLSQEQFKIICSHMRLIWFYIMGRHKYITSAHKSVCSSHYEKFLATGEVKCIDDEIPFEIPQGWAWCRISGIVQINPKNSAPDDAKAAFIPMEKIDATYLSSFTYEFRKWGDIKTGFTHFANGDIAFAKITPCFQNRKSMILVDLPNGIGAGTTELKVLRVFGDTINSKYLLFFLESPYFVEEASFKGTANQQRIISGYLENKLFPLPPKEEQKRIVKIIEDSFVFADSFGLAQSKLDTLNRNVKVMLKKSILQQAIQGRLVPQIAEEGTAQELLEQIRQEKALLVKESKLKKSALQDSVIFKGDDNRYFEKVGNKTECVEIPFNIPHSWCWMRLRDLCTITNGFTPLKSEAKYWKNGTVNWFTVDDIHKQGEYIYQTSHKITEIATSKDRIVRPGSVLLCCTASVGQCAMTMIPTTTNQQFNALSIKEEYRILVNEYFLFLFTKTLEPVLHELAGKTTFEFISVKKVGNILIPIPPLQEQARIVAKVEELNKVVN